MGRKNQNRRGSLEKVIGNFLTAKQVEGKTKASLSFYRGNWGLVMEQSSMTALYTA